MTLIIVLGVVGGLALILIVRRIRKGAAPDVQRLEHFTDVHHVNRVPGRGRGNRRTL